MCLINDNIELTNDQKLFYLKAALRGETKFIETSDDTFESLFAALEERFENKRAVVDIHIRNMLKLEKLNFESAKGLRNITDTINKSLRGLKSLNLECNDLTSAILVNIILERLDKESRKAYEMSIQSKQIPSLKELLQFLESRAMVLDQLGKYPTSNKFHKEFQGSINKPKNFLHDANKLSNVKPCILCKFEHPLQRCSEFLKLSVTKRIELLEKYNICKNCLKLHKPPCKSTFLCRSCQKSGHNSLIHLDPKLLSTLLAEATPPDAGEQLYVNNEPSGSSRFPQKLTPEAESALASNSKLSSNLLCTAQLFIEDAFGQKIKIKALLDSGSSLQLGTSLFCAGLDDARMEILGLFFRIAFSPSQRETAVSRYYLIALSRNICRAQ
ncbi:hypothetical protein HNY73_008089 [Argiope bruennichi]|uniref:Peptidase aspartic putative domain-containing protein n=1 Tax=Argiope bruennichi TaxID=94029 RepID=A0A8T0F7R0_ARGBR|nr:hypothetical protein HNY73_008089 [Argiope bruennichi]